QGAVLTEGDYDTVSADPRVREVYMGTDSSGERGSSSEASEVEAAE
ncbi:MAG: ABC transporter ATP-binding protein, partial [Marinobacter sp.]